MAKPKPIQHDLFGIPSAPLSRTRDEVTSKLAEFQLIDIGDWQAQMAEVLKLVIDSPGRTAREYDEMLPGSLRAGGKCHKRLPDLQKKGFVRKGDKRVCRITGKLAITWWPATRSADGAEEEKL